MDFVVVEREGIELSPDPVTRGAVSLRREICFFVKEEEATVEANEGNWKLKAEWGSGGWRRKKLPAVACGGIRLEARSGESQGFSFELISF